jgi:DNA-binding SARP family transcriptional activator/tetratricopeptide (TPR) repeat protein
MDFLILGPLEAHDEGGRKLPLGGSKQRALLGMLLLHANEVVSSDRLIEELWARAASHDAAKALQAAMSRLRKVLEPGRPPGEPGRLLITRPPGYEVAVSANQLDLFRFERLVAEARETQDPRAAARGLGEALALWRGPPLADLAFESFAQADIARLEELRLAALEDRIRADLELGRHAELTGELEGLVREHPLRERLQALLMLALYRSGRQAEALEAYAAARRALVDELGIEPGRELSELQRSVLAQDSSLDPPAAAAPRVDGVPPPAEPLIGREAELAALTPAVERSLAGRGGIVLVSGEPGIGKSRLAEELATRARAGGAHVVWGRCWEAGGAPAYWPWLQSLRSYAVETEPDVLRAQLATAAGDLAQLVPGIRDLFPDVTIGPALDSEGGRFRLFDAATGFLKRAAAARPLVLVLDDLHAADAPSLLLLQFIARELRQSRLLVVGAYRDIDPIVRDPLATTLVELAREPDTTHVRLAGLDEAGVTAYIESSAGVTPAPRLVEAVHRETEGNPLFVAEVVRLLDSEGRLAGDDAQLRIPPSVRAVISRRVGRLSERCQRLLLLASVLGRGFDLQVLALLSEHPGDDLLEVLDEAMTERVVGELPGARGRFRFNHALIRDTLYDELTPARRLQLHRRAGEALEAAHADDLEPHLAELAHHFVAAAPAGAEAKALDYATRAGDRATSLLAHEEAVRHYELALTLVDDDHTRCELLLALGEAEARAGDTPASKQAFREAADLAEDGGAPEQVARAAVGYGGRIIWEVSRGEEDHLVPLIERALAALGDGDSALRVRLLTRLAGGPLRDASFSPDRKEALSREALEMARRIGDPDTLAFGLAAYILGHHSPPNTPQLLELARELVETATAAGNKERALDGYEELFDALFELGDLPAAKEAHAKMAELAAELRQPSQDWLVAVYRPTVALLEGRLAEAESLMRDARGLGRRALSWNAEVSFALQLYVLRWEQGRIGELEEMVRRAVGEYPTYPLWRCVLAHMTAELGDRAETRRLLDALAADGFAVLPFDEEWLVGMGFLAETARSLEAGDHAGGLYDRLLPWADRIAISYPEISIGPVARFLGVLAMTMARPDNAVAHFEGALATSRRIGARPALARTELDYAAVLLEGGTGSGAARAGELLESCLATAREIGMEPLVRRASALRERITVRGGSPPRRSPPS